MLRRRIFWSVILVLTAGAAFAQSRNESRLDSETANPPKAAARELIAGREAPSAAPLNPHFVDYLKERAERRVRRMTTADGHGLGLIPSPLDSSHLRGQGRPALLFAGSFPASYDLRAGKMTPVKDQGPCGSIWAFAAYGSLESVLLPAETWDFSENNLKNLNGFDFEPCGGGWMEMALGYLARWGSSSFQTGPVIESDDPYQATDSNTSPPFPPGAPIQKHVQDVTQLGPRQNATDNDALKNALMQYGGVYTTLLWSDGAYNPATYSYYFDLSTDIAGGVAVTLAGWDDNYPASEFLNPPPGNGAFLAKNSWGPAWGDGGYFWISYYDLYCATYSSWVFETVEPLTNYTRQYQYDPLGWVDSWGFNSTTGWFKNVFTAAANEDLQAVSTYVASNSSPYSIYVFTGNTLAGEAIGVFSAAGYHTVELPTPVALAKGQQFTVELALTTPGYNWPIPIHYAGFATSKAPAVSPGQSYVSPDGQNWTDTTTINPEWATPGTTSVALKAFTNLTPDFTLGPASGSPASRAITAGETASFSLAFARVGSFAGTVNLSCGVSPAVALAPTCTVPASVQISGSGTQTAKVEVATTAATAVGAVPPAAMPWLWASMALGMGLLRLWTRWRGGVLAAPAIFLALTLGTSCGGGSGPSAIATPPGTYAVTVTANSGSLSHNTALQVIVREIRHVPDSGSPGDRGQQHK